ncbi:MAG: ECF-type sigma factor [Tepidisphaerales bacterium]
MLLQRVQHGDKHAVDALFPLVYAELRRKAQFYMSQESPTHTLQATALVHEAYQRLVNGPVDCANRRHFFNAAALAMRQILVDHSRRKNAEKRGGQHQRLDVADIDVPIGSGQDDVDYEALDIALAKLQKEDQRHYEVVMYRYFAGLGEQEIAELMAIATKTVQRYWNSAKMFLLAEMTGGGPETAS